jgi:hypothetical protein
MSSSLKKHILPEISPPFGRRGFTLLNVNCLKRIILNLINSTSTMVITQNPLFNRVKGRGVGFLLGQIPLWLRGIQGDFSKFKIPLPLFSKRSL